MFYLLNYLLTAGSRGRQLIWRPEKCKSIKILRMQVGVITARFSRQTEDQAFCPVIQLLWLRASHCTDYHVTSLLFLRVTCPCSLRTYATLMFIRSSSSSSSSTAEGASRLSRLLAFSVHPPTFSELPRLLACSLYWSSCCEAGKVLL